MKTWLRKITPLKLLSLTLLGIGLSLFFNSKQSERLPVLGQYIAKAKQKLLTRERVANLVAPHIHFYRFPNQVQIPHEILEETGIQSNQAIIQYSFDPALQEQMESYIKSYSPDYCAFVALDPTSGRILSMISFVNNVKKDAPLENLALKATFPSASVFKVVTAAAAIEQKKFGSDTVFAFQGSNHTLYKSNVLKMKYNRWTRNITLRDAFAKSVNTVFGRIGVYNVGAQNLRNYADKFGFNRKIAAEFEVDTGHAPIPDDDWGIAEAASGYTRENTMSPLQGALIASAIANQGLVMEPYIIDSIFSLDGAPLYTVEPRLASKVVDPQTATSVKELMRQTIKSGTSRSVFKTFLKNKNNAEIDVGGKTGSLTGLEPPGRYDWFVGYGDNGKQKIALAALAIHGQYWKVKSSVLARKAIEIYFKTPSSPAPRPKKMASKNRTSRNHSSRHITRQPAPQAVHSDTVVAHRD